MKISKTTIALLISLSFNFGFLGALGYRMYEQHHRTKKLHEHQVFVKAVPDSMETMLWLELDEDQEKVIQIERGRFQPRVHDIRLKLHEERKDLSDLLMQEQVDTILIESTIDSIGKLQADIEKEVVYQVLREKNELDPDQHHRFLRVVVEKLNEDHINLKYGQRHVIKKRFIDEHGNVTENIEIFEEEQKEQKEQKEENEKKVEKKKE